MTYQIQLLLDLLDLRGNVITIDAMGCQKVIAEKIRVGGGDYILALKSNHGTLHKDVKLFLESEVIKTVSNNIDNCHEEIDAGHGRIELRKCIVSSKIDWLEEKADWPGLKTIIIELDGGHHTETVEYDNRRTEFLESQGYKVLRVWNHEIFTNIDGVFEVLLDLLESVPG